MGLELQQKEWTEAGEVLVIFDGGCSGEDDGDDDDVEIVVVEFDG